LIKPNEAHAMSRTEHPWQFAARFRRNAFGWRSETPIQRIKEALAEIKQVARSNPIMAADGAVLFLEKLSPALEQVDSSSGVLGKAVNRAIETLVSIIAKADVEVSIRQRWLDRLWEAFQNDGIPYLEALGDSWGELCVTPDLALQWVEKLLPSLEVAWHPQSSEHRYFKGESACLSSLFKAGHYKQLLNLLERAPFKWWYNRRWGVKALCAMGKQGEAIRYAEESRGLNTPSWQISQVCESILLSAGLSEEAYRRYALDANQGKTHLATFRSVAKKYPNKQSDEILHDLVASTPGSEGKWFAAAKDAGLFDLALKLASISPTDPQTLARATRDFGETLPDFAMACGLAALRWISLGHGYEITSMDILNVYVAVIKAAPRTGQDEHRIREQISQLIADETPENQFLKAILAPQLLFDTGMKPG
jgi:hypothetical protein